MDPMTEPIIPGTFSQLYLLRRDIRTCFGINANTGQQLPTQALWPGVMGICAGVDLLGKFLVGNDKKGEVGKRFRDFLITFFNVSQNDAETLYQLRNSLLHSFGLYSEVTDKTGKVVQVYKFVLNGNTRRLITPRNDNVFVIDIDTFYENFESAIGIYETMVKTDVNLQVNFANMFSKHHRIRIG
jgi:hypothetical protein